MSKKCSRCEKTVYPLEELKCLEKVWHKTCFKCQECGMTLNMRTYKGFNRMPYCNAHCPMAKHTTVADTPEIRRIQENTKIQSTVRYHEDFEKNKGKVTQIADDPETLRIKQNTRIISNVAYHGDLEKKAIMEQRRPLSMGEKNGDDDDVIEPPEMTLPSSGSWSGVVPKEAEPAPPPPQPQPLTVTKNEPEPTNHQAKGLDQPILRKFAEMEPGVNAKESPYSTSRQTSTLIYTSEHGPVTNPASRRIGSIADCDPLNDKFGSLSSATKSDGMVNKIGDGEPHGVSAQVLQNNHPLIQNTGLAYRAMYDYAAADVDEVSFQDGDIILNCMPIDEGWMTGTVQRSGQTGMLPANYVEPCN